MKRKNFGKKIMAAIMAAALTGSLFQGTTVSAAELGEAQAGGMQAEAAYLADSIMADTAELPLNQEAAWSLQAKEEVHAIRFTATDSPDTFYTLAYANTGAEGIQEMCISKSADFLEEDIIERDTIHPKKSKAINLAKLEAGHAYYIKVNYASYAEFTGESPYKIKVSTVEDDVKDSAGDAEEIPLDQEVGRGLQNKEDVDVFRFTAKGAPNVFYTLTFTNTGEEGVQEIEISKGVDFLEEDKIANETIHPKKNKMVNLVKLEAGHTYYIRVNYASYMEFAKESPYKIKVSSIEDDAEDQAGNAKAISIGSPISSAIQNREDVDIFCFKTPDTDSFYEFKFSNSSGKTMLYGIYDNVELTGDAIADGGVSGKQEKQEDLYKLKRNKTYYIRVNMASWDTYEGVAPYMLLVSSRLDDSNNRVNNGDDKTENFTVIQPGKEVKKGIQNIADVDYFRFTVTENDNFYTLKFINNADNGLFCKVWDNQSYVGAPVQEGSAGKGRPLSINFGKLKKGKTYYVKVEHASYESFTATKNYSLKLTKAKDDIKDTASSAKALSLNKSGKYKLQNTEDVDYFKFTTSDFEDYHVDFANLSKKGTVYITIYNNKKELDNGGKYKAVLPTYACSGKKAIDAQSQKLKLGRYKTYYIKITGDTEASYELGINAAAPSSKKIKMAGSRNAKLSWGKVKRATGYEIYRAEKKNGKESKYKKIKVIKKGSTVSYIDKSLKKGKVYSYKIRAFREVKGKKTCYSAFSKVQSKKI